MHKRKIEAPEYAAAVVRGLQPGLLLTTKTGDKINTMAIGWGTVGRVWEKPVFIAFVRDRRYTRQMLDGSGEFTVNVPVGPVDRKLLGFCGSRSGRDLDKIAAAGMTTVEPEIISAPGLKEFPLTLECRVLYRQEQEADKLDGQIRRSFYSVETDDHICFYGEIVAAYVIED